MNNKTLHLFVGPSASGKTTIANELEKWGYKQVKSYTTRMPRYEGEDNHTFVTDEEFNELKNIIAYTEYNGHRYCATKEQIDNADIYVVDIDGVKTLLEKYDSLERLIKIWYFDSNASNRIGRMIKRGDSDTAIVGRLYNDEAYDWWDKLDTLVNYHKYFGDAKIVQLNIVDANDSIDNILCYID